MQQKTSNKQFEKYGNVYGELLDVAKTTLQVKNYRDTAKNIITQLYHFDCEVFIEMYSGMAVLLVGDSPETDRLESFAIHHFVKLNPGCYFSLIALSPTISYKLIYASGSTFSTVTLQRPYFYQRILPQIHVREILGYYYSIRISGYHFKGEKHDYFELTYVDRGCMQTEVDKQTFELKERDLIIYGPGQFHTQRTPLGQSCSYTTIIFYMESVNPVLEPIPYDLLLNRVFHYDKKIHNLIQSFVHESDTELPYHRSLQLCLLLEIVIRLFQYNYSENEDIHMISNSRQHYQDELLEKILSYIDDSICEPLTVAEICQKFSVSRSFIQILFKENLDQTPKKYIIDLKLERSCQMIRENKYNISEIALMLGFNSIHYFSRAFTKKYNLAPSEYSKQIFTP